jgi:hypothetical protein
MPEGFSRPILPRPTGLSFLPRARPRHCLLLLLLGLAATLFPIGFPAGSGRAWAAEDSKALAESIARQLMEKFRPERVEVTTDGRMAYAEATGAVLDGIRIDSMRLEAVLRSVPRSASADVEDLANRILTSKGEIVLTERDVNAYFARNEESGFTNLKFDFSREGFRASGVFTAEFLFTLRIRLRADGILSLRSDGVYLDRTRIFVENIQQPEALTGRIIERVNPLLEFSSIPFPVRFRSLSMDDAKVTLTGDPKPLPSGEKAVLLRGAVSPTPAVAAP